MKCCPVTPADEMLEHRCRSCSTMSQPVFKKTVLFMLKPELLRQATAERFRFCAAPDCPIVYFEAQSNIHFTTDDLRVVVGVKAKTDPIPLCYCFGFYEHHIRAEVDLTGATVVPETISSLIREDLCACDSRNPSGMCCLGEVNRTAKRLTADRQARKTMIST